MQHERTVNRDNTVVIGNRVLQLEKTRWKDTLAGQTVMVHEHLDGRVSIRYGPQLIAEYAGDGLPLASPRRKHTAKLLEAGGGLTQFGRRSWIETGGSASRPPGFNAFGQDCWKRERALNSLPQSRP